MKNRRLFSILFILMSFSASICSAEAYWYVNILGDNHQLIEGASTTPNIVAGSFVDKSFVGKKLYVQSKEHYELDSFRPKPVENNGGAVSGSMSASADEASVSATKEENLTTKFGPLTDSGLEIAQNGDFHGWWCSNLYVTPLGGRKYELSCNETMKYQ